MPLIETHYAKRWTGFVDGVFVEIVNWYSSPDGDWDHPVPNRYGGISTTWNYYLTFTDEMMSKQDFNTRFWLPTKKIHDRYDEDYYCDQACFFNSAPWHGGVTFYEKTNRNHPKGRRSVKIGCDYAHAWDHDRGFEYEFYRVLADATNTVEYFRRTPEIVLFHRCPYDGKYRPLSEMTDVDGVLYGPKGYEYAYNRVHRTTTPETLTGEV